MTPNEWVNSYKGTLLIVGIGCLLTLIGIWRAIVYFKVKQPEPPVAQEWWNDEESDRDVARISTPWISPSLSIVEGPNDFMLQHGMISIISQRILYFEQIQPEEMPTRWAMRHWNIVGTSTGFTTRWFLCLVLLSFLNDGRYTGGCFCLCAGEMQRALVKGTRCNVKGTKLAVINNQIFYTMDSFLFLGAYYSWPFPYNGDCNLHTNM
ncbi:unnamed protein product, partial [Fusarium graminearum]